MEGIAERSVEDKKPAQAIGSRARLFKVVLVVVGLAATAAWIDPPLIGGLARLTLAALALSLLAWLGVARTRRLLWRVGRRLALIYLLIGVVPIVIVTAQLLVGAYLLSGFFLGRLFENSLAVVTSEVRTAARLAASQADDSELDLAGLEHLSVVRYREGQRSDPEPRAPDWWPQWLQPPTISTPDERTPSVVALGDGSLSLAAVWGDSERGALAFLDRDLALLLSERSQVWVELAGLQERGGPRRARVTIGGSEWILTPLQRTEAPEVAEAFYQRMGTDPRLLVIGLETVGALYSLADGELLSESVSATLFAPPSTVISSLVSSSAEIDTLAWIAFIVPAFLLFDLYVIASLMATLLIFGLSRAVNQLSNATNSVQQGDFSVRIPVRRRDQIGALQHSFNEMAANLEKLVGAAAQKEILDRELEIARDVQKSLLPGDLRSDDGSIEVATYFQPSAAIGGDYFDLVRLGDPRQRLAVVIADVSGHGLSAGLRMAMIKAALGILVQEGKDAEGILTSLDAMVRANRDSGSFVTATLSLIDPAGGSVEITNAGHPPTYLLRNGDVEEVLLPGSPLGGLGREYPRRAIELQRNDILVWLSDGLIEAVDADGNSFGYDRTVESLRGVCSSAPQVRDRLIDAVRQHTGRTVTDDDQTLVVLQYLAG